MNAAKSEYLDYKTARVEWKKTYGEKVIDSMSLKERLRQKEQIVKIISAMGRRYGELWMRAYPFNFM